MKFFKKWGLAAGFTFLIVVFASIIIVSSSLTFRKTLTGLAHNIMENIASYTLDKSEDYLRPAEKAAELTKFLADSNIVTSEDPSAMISYFYQQISLYPQFTSVYYGNTKGEFFMASRSNSIVEGGYYTKLLRKNGDKITGELLWTDQNFKVIKEDIDETQSYDPRTRPWYNSAVRHNDVIWTDPYVFFTGKKPGITTASPVYDANGKLLGVVGVDITIDELSTFLSKTKVGKTGKAFIVNRNGDVVAFPDISKLRRSVGVDNKIRLSKMSELDDETSRLAYDSLPHRRLPSKQIFTTFTQNGSKYNAMFTPFKGSQWPWTIGIYMPEDDYLGEVKANRNVNIIISIFVVLLAGLAGLVVAKRIEKSREEAVAANVAKSRFLAVMSHEIRTPMNVILGTTDLLKATGLSEEQQKLVNLLGNAGEGLTDLINDILDMSKVEAGLLDLEHVPFDPRDVVERACSVFVIAASTKGIGFSWNIDSEIPASVLGDPGRTRQVLINLIGNAVKFTTEGQVQVDVTLEEGYAENKVRLNFAVQDSGPGIPEERLESIFESFTQADTAVSRKYGGAGLGLTISKRLSIMMGGDIRVESKLSEGSTFVFMASFEGFVSSVDFGEKGLIERVDSLSPLTILLVEDNASNRMLFQYYLEDSGHKVEMAENGKAGFEIYKSIRPDIVFMDIEMPIMDGYESTRAIRQWENYSSVQAVPIVALSAHALKGMEESVREAGCTGYATKPFSKKQLKEQLEKYF
ncbi:MAG: histidine kinase [Desulfovibrio sp. S3730MH75]|nr:MAG: histidine kinase [Desulfovibrio sp. S3730MH75]